MNALIWILGLVFVAYAIREKFTPADSLQREFNALVYNLRHAQSRPEFERICRDVGRFKIKYQITDGPYEADLCKEMDKKAVEFPVRIFRESDSFIEDMN